MIKRGHAWLVPRLAGKRGDAPPNVLFIGPHSEGADYTDRRNQEQRGTKIFVKAPAKQGIDLPQKSIQNRLSPR
jgi:hypothetical protein